MYTFLIIFAVLYGLYSVMRHWQENPNHSSFIRLVTTFIINALVFPISIIIAMVKNTLVPTKDEHRRFMLLLGFKKYRNKK